MDMNTAQIDALMNRLRRLNRVQFNALMYRTATRVGVKAEEFVRDYPPPSGKPLPAKYTRTRKDGTTYQSKFKSDKQQGAVMAMAKAGKFPTKRTGGLGASITSEVTVEGNTWTARVGTNKDYAHWVLGDPDDEDVSLRQADYHEGTWTPIVDTIQQHEADLHRLIEGDFNNAIDTYFL